MVEAAEIGDGHSVVELGAGTGPITRAILEGHTQLRLLALEPTPDLAAKLRVRFPSVQVEERYAQDLPEIVAGWGHPKVDRVVSGLPWTLWSEEVCHSGLSAVARSLRHDGRMVTFSYVHSQTLMPSAWRFRRQLRQHFAVVRRTEVQWLNAPPAVVFVCEQPLG
jgi:phospholipid N-methyltransferase